MIHAITVRRLLRDAERVEAIDVEQALAAAAAAWERLRVRPEVVALRQAARVMAEVPFSLRVADDDGEMVLRGTIDCLAIADDGAVTVVEFKTGRPHPAHDGQLALYVEAVRALFPGAPVEGRLIYA